MAANIIQSSGRSSSEKCAAEAYLRTSKDKMPLEESTTKLTGADPMILFMARTGNFKNKPAGGKELLFPEAEM